MSTAVYDAVVVGAGSVGLPAAMEMAEQGLKVLCIDQFASPGQGSNKAAIGGIRATHSSPAKIRLCLDSIRVFSTWKERRGDNIEWFQSGYLFVAYREEEERILKDLLKVQKSYGLNIDWHDKESLLELVPSLKKEGLRGGTYSPEDGSASPQLSSHAFYQRAKALGVGFRLGERVTSIIRRKGKVVGVRTDKGGYATGTVVNAAGAWARQLAQSGGLDVPVQPDCHEAGITEPTARFLKPMVVDLRPEPGSRNYYFYQHGEPGQVLFCITPEPQILGTDRRETSSFLPMIARRMVDLMPRLANVKVRRTWRGLYPNTPDGSPIIGPSPTLQGYIDAVGMCGQGYMLGPGVGALVSRMVTGKLSGADGEVLKELAPGREFGGTEALK
ncbi:MAG TPA: sulfurtransferase [Myxococcales bacterium]|nr:sulfurtransferase [Myxococcales bacterium]